MSTSINVSYFIEKSKELLGPDADYSYITSELILEDEQSPDEMELIIDTNNIDPVVWYGNNARYGTRVINGSTYSVYYFDHGGNVLNSNLACGNRVRGAWIRMDMWNHRHIGSCPNGREKWRFTQ